MTSDIPEAAFWIPAVAAVVSLFLLARRHRGAAALKARCSALEAGLLARDEEMGHLTAVRLPAILELSDRSESVPGLLHPQLTATPFARSVEQVADMVVRSEESTQRRATQAATAALKASMRVLQGLANEQQLAISEMQETHDDPQVLHDLLGIDHMNAQFSRRAQAISVLCGSWPGRQRAAAPLVDVVRGATSRIRDYRRVQVYEQVDSAVVSRAVEPAVLVVAELLDNAARHSQPNTMVQVSLQPAHNGVSMVIDDAGVGLRRREIERAQALLSGQQEVDVSRLGDPPQFGFAVIGLLAARYGFSVSVDTQSPYGGVRAVVFLPSALLTPLGAQTETRTDASADVSRTAEQDFAETQPVLHTESALHLPKRRRRQPVAAPSSTAAQPEQGSAEVRSANDAAALLGAFSRGTRSGRGFTPDAEGTRDA
ncbi:ATP-binding protein [Streptomyces sp. NBC_00271]|uniref:ATP-binding protein n=1 Tax=Streptomyces sp. NBC_00271 TaxID=2975697 RepID=UPI002E2A7E10|nr:ATP-binding protein [Streptomyces sp. NBC_00271]